MTNLPGEIVGRLRTSNNLDISTTKKEKKN